MSEPDHTRAQARGEELHENLAATDARRAEEEAAKAQEATEQAAKEQEKREREARDERERAQRVHEQADRARGEADDAVASRVSGAAVASPGVGSRTDPNAQASAGRGDAAIPGLDRLPPAAQRPEVLVGAVFAGSFVVARILKRIFD